MSLVLKIHLSQAPVCWLRDVMGSYLLVPVGQREPLAKLTDIFAFWLTQQAKFQKAFNLAYLS